MLVTLFARQTRLNQAAVDIIDGIAMKKITPSGCSSCQGMSSCIQRLLFQLASAFRVVLSKPSVSGRSYDGNIPGFFLLAYPMVSFPLLPSCSVVQQLARKYLKKQCNHPCCCNIWVRKVGKQLVSKRSFSRWPIVMALGFTLPSSISKCKRPAIYMVVSAYRPQL